MMELMEQLNYNPPQNDPASAERTDPLNEMSVIPSGYQIIHIEYFSRRDKPMLTVTHERFYVNIGCIKHFPEYDYAQILINTAEKKLLLLPKKLPDCNSFKWCSAGKKRIGNKIKCPDFLDKLYHLMKWNPEYRYSCIGFLSELGQEPAVMFELNKYRIVIPDKTEHITKHINPESTDFKENVS